MDVARHYLRCGTHRHALIINCEFNYREYANWNAIDADCGTPCDNYWEANPRPEEGSEEYQTWQEAWEAFRDHYAQHRDEIYRYRVDLAKN